MRNYLLSIIIPTKNREEYAYCAIKQIMGLNDERIQLVVHDNSDNNSLNQLLKKEKYNNLTYIHNTEELSAVENFNCALSYAQGEYICMIGDDDGILSNIIDTVQWMKSNGIDAVKPIKNIVYHWPKSLMGKNKNNATLKIYHCKKKMHKMNTEAAVKRLLQEGGQKYTEYDLITAYHCIIKKERMDEVKARTGQCFGGVSPDIYNAVCLSLLPYINAYYVGVPVSISGICKASTSADSAEGKHFGRLEEVSHLKNIEQYSWDCDIPRIYSVETVWAETALKAIKDMQREDLRQFFNKKKLLQLLYKNNYKHFREINEILGENIDFSKKIGMIRIKKVIRKEMTKIYIFLRKLVRIDRVYSNVQDIQQAHAILLKYTKKWRGIFE